MADTTVNAVETNIVSKRRTRNVRNKVEQNSVDDVAMTMIPMETETTVTIPTETETALVRCRKGSNNSNDKQEVSNNQIPLRGDDITTPAMRSETTVDAVETN